MPEAPLAYMTYAEWARRCGKSRERARQVVEKKEIFGAVPLINTPEHSKYIVPWGAPWPEAGPPGNTRMEARPRRAGYISLVEFALKHGKKRYSGHQFARDPNNMPPGSYAEGKHWWVPEDAVWPERKKETQKRKPYRARKLKWPKWLKRP